jgi:hypothetical protein
VEIACPGTNDDVYDQDVDPDIMADCCPKDDVAKAKEMVKHKMEAKTKKEKLRKSSQLIAVSKTMLNKPKRRSAATKRVIEEALKAEKIHTKKGRERWFATVMGDAAYLQKWMPAGSSLYQDDNGGRGLLTHLQKRKSVSWTVRGMKKGSLHALRWLWKAHKDRGTLS